MSFLQVHSEHCSRHRVAQLKRKRFSMHEEARGRRVFSKRGAQMRFELVPAPLKQRLISVLFGWWNQCLLCKCLASHELEAVGRGIEAVESAEVPVVLYGAEEGEVVVDGVVSRSGGEHGAESDGVDVVVVEIVVLVPGDDDEGAGRELGEAWR